MADFFYKSSEPETVAIVRSFYVMKDAFSALLVALADVFGMTLLLSEAGETFMLSKVSIWVQPVAIALSVAQQEVDHV